MSLSKQVSRAVRLTSLTGLTIAFVLFEEGADAVDELLVARFVRNLIVAGRHQLEVLNLCIGDVLRE